MNQALALHAAVLFALDPVGLGGVRLRARAGPARERWLAALQSLLPRVPRRLPLHVDDQRLLGGLDFAATLGEGRPVHERGLLAACDGGVVCIPMAERLPPALAGRLAGVLDRGVVPQATGDVPARIGVLALDEGVEPDEALAAALADRLAIHLWLDDRSDAEPLRPYDLAAARHRLHAVEVDAAMQRHFCEAAALLGIPSLRAPLLAVRVARCAAALAGRSRADRDDVDVALQLVLAPRARQLPVAPQEAEETAQPAQTARPSSDVDTESAQPDAERPLDERVLDAVHSVLPPGLLQALAGPGLRQAPPSSGRSGASTGSRQRGRPVGSQRGLPRGGARLDLIATLRSAAPWQPLRRREGGRDGVVLQRDDLQVRRCHARRQTTTIFAVDASGSAALHRLAEAKGAVERLLADCYVRRDQVALIAFRGLTAELLLPPTRSLPRARRCLCALPGGGGTPLAAGLAAAQALALSVQRQGHSTSLVLLTDGRANIALDGRPGREAAQQDALTMARQLSGMHLPALLIDTSPQAHAVARQVAEAMGARYLALPYADAQQLSRAVAASATLVSR